jgi:DNA gyrase subunit A
VEDYRITNRGGKGVMAMNITDKTGKLVAIKEVDDQCDLLIITKSGITIRLSVKDLRVQGRVTQGVRLVKIGEKDEIASVAKIVNLDTDEDATEAVEGITNEITAVNSKRIDSGAEHTNESVEPNNDNPEA